MFSFGDFVVWLNVMVIYIYIYVCMYVYIIREATVALLQCSFYGKYRRSIAGEAFI